MDGWLKHTFLHVNLYIQVLGWQMPRADIFGEISSNVQFRNSVYILWNINKTIDDAHGV